jgi:tetratricopeptide (TPR) repeat protein
MVKLDQVSKLLTSADKYAADGEYAAAIELYDEALKLLPAEHKSQNRRIRLEKAKAQMMVSELPTAHADLKLLCEELQADKSDEKLLSEVRSTRAQAEYYTTWLMRLEGLPQDDWEPEIESARQTYRLLAEQAEAKGDSKAAQKNREDLESAIRLARMDLSDLQGLAIPCQCKGCCSCKKRGRSPSKSANKPQDARGASSGPPPDTSGH